MSTVISRRSFITYAALSAAALTAIGRSAPASAAGEALPHLSDKDPMAKALHYTANARAITPGKYPGFKAGDHCSGCQFFKGAANEASGYAGCAIYPGYSVAAEGWCASFNARA